MNKNDILKTNYTLKCEDFEDSFFIDSDNFKDPFLSRISVEDTEKSIYYTITNFFYNILDRIKML